MDNVEVFDSGIEAMHKVKELIAEIDRESERVYLAYCDYYDQWYVTNDGDDLTSAIHKRWCDGGCDNSPESESNNWNIWEYVMAVKQERFPHTYRDSKRSVIRSDIPMIRKKRSIGCEYSVEFTIE